MISMLWSYLNCMQLFVHGYLNIGKIFFLCVTVSPLFIYFLPLLFRTVSYWLVISL